MQKLRTAFVNQAWIPSLPPGGSLEIWTHEVARRLVPRCDVAVYGGARLPRRTATDRGVAYRTFPTIADGAVQRVLALLPLARDPLRPAAAARRYYLGYALQVAANLRARRVDVVHVQNQFPFVPTIRALNRGAKIVLHMHCEWLSQLDHGYVHRAVRDADAVMACSDHVAERVRARFPRYSSKCHTVHNGVDLDVFTPPPARPRDAGCGPRLLSVGRISPEKGLHVLIDAFAEVARRYPSAELTMVGSYGVLRRDHIVDLSDDPLVRDLARFYDPAAGDYVDQLRACVPRALAGRVHFPGSMSHAEIAGLCRGADILINPSLSESFGMPIAEAMAAGCPVVATRVGGIPEIVEHERTGLLVAPNDASALAEAIVRLAGEPTLRASMGEAGRARVLERFSWDRVADDTFALYSALHGAAA